MRGPVPSGSSKSVFEQTFCKRRPSGGLPPSPSPPPAQRAPASEETISRPLAVVWCTFTCWCRAQHAESRLTVGNPGYYARPKGVRSRLRGESFSSRPSFHVLKARQCAASCTIAFLHSPCVKPVECGLWLLVFGTEAIPLHAARQSRYLDMTEGRTRAPSSISDRCRARLNFSQE